MLPVSDGISTQRFPSVNVACAAFFAHVGGFAFGVAVTHALLGSGRVRVRRNGAIRARG
jgi:hypothetical protein